MPQSPSFRKKFVFPSLSILLALSVTLLITETGYRIYKFGFTREALVSYFRVDEDGDLIHRSLPVELNQTFGWIPSAKFNNEKNIWGVPITVLPDSSRSNGQLTPKNDHCSILAIGDSFTFGDEVGDNESWPAYLEENLKCPVINAGVCAYGIDQASMRAKKFIEMYQPKVLVFSMIMDDIFRTRQNIRQGLAKPYYTVENDSLVLHEIPEGFAESTREFSVRNEQNRVFRDFFDRSYIIHDLMNRLIPKYWRGIQDKYVKNDPEDVSCRLLRELDQYTQEKNIRFFLVFQHLASFISNPLEMEQSLRIEKCLQGTRISVLDTHWALKAVFDKDPKAFDALFLSHMTAKGNKVTADAIAEHLRAQMIDGFK